MKWEAKLVKHNKEDRTVVYFKKDAGLIARIKKLAEVKWSNTSKAWHLPDTEENRKKFNIECPMVLNTIHLQKILQFKRWLTSKRYSESTVKTYCEALSIFLRFFNTKPIEKINNEDVIEFNHDYIIKNKFSSSIQNQMVNAIKLFFLRIEDKAININLVHRPKREKVLPNVLSKEEVKLILDAHSNIKHKTMLSLIYSCGLRCGELIALKPVHIDSKRNIVLLKNAKGKKDRVVPLSPKILDMLRDYYKTCKPTNFLFEGQTAGKEYDARSLQLILKQALAKTGITKPVTLHWLRHSYATHLLESGTDLRYIQELLGHSSSKTTEIYTLVSIKSIQQIKSPFDDL